MTDHPAMFDMSPDGQRSAAGHSASNRQSSLKSMLCQAVIVGLFGGVALIGLVENVTRFGDPAAIHAEARQINLPASAPLDLRPAGLQDAVSVHGPRSDRLDISMGQALDRGEAMQTDVAIR